MRASLYELPFEDGSLDGVWSAATLLHVPHGRLAEALAEIRRVLRPGGVAFCSVKPGEGERMVEGDLGARFFAFHDADGFAFSEAGFDVARVERLERAGAEWITLFARRGRWSAPRHAGKRKRAKASDPHPRYPVGESNPCFRRERAASWTTRRTGRVV